MGAIEVKTMRNNLKYVNQVSRAWVFHLGPAISGVFPAHTGFNSSVNIQL